MPVKKITHTTLFCIILFSLILSACTSSTTTPTIAVEPTAEIQKPADTQVSATAEPTRPSGPKVVNFIWKKEFDTLNPFYSKEQFSTFTQQIWNCWAWDFDEKNTPHPVLVKDIPSLENGGISADGNVITLKLRDDIVWSDGTPITSRDFLFTYQMILNPNNAVATTSPYDKIISLDTPDERTVVMTFNEPYISWLSTLWHGLLPAHILEPVFQAEGTINNATWNNAPSVGCGPFNFDKWEAGNFAHFVANEKYWLGKPILAEITFHFVADDAAQIAAIKAGGADLGTFLSYSDAPIVQSGGMTFVPFFSGYNEGWFFYLDPQMSNPALQDVRVRLAIALAIDRASFVKDALLGITKPAISYWDNTPYIEPTLQPWRYDPETAKKLLDETGWVDSNADGVRDKDGEDLVLTYGTTTSELRQKAQAAFQQQLEAVGIKVELFNYERDIFFKGYGSGGPAATGQLDIFEYAPIAQRSPITIFPDPDTADFLCTEIPTDESTAGKNWTFYCDQELEQLFQLQSTQMDFKARQETFWKISKLIYERVYFLGLWEDSDLWSISTRITGAKISGITPFFNILEWDIY
jgi:peptide/nickel transport system substrate-binding protein